MRNNKESFFDYCKRNNRIDLLDEWNYDKNNSLNPTDVSSGSGKKIWWICKDGHEWDSRVIDRKRNKNCPYCANKKVLEGYNDLATTHPEISKEWHPTKNGDLKPTHVVAGSNKKVWWQCNKGHEWDISPNVRTGKGNNCPYCSNQKVLEGYNDLVTTHPKLSKEWHSTKNGDLKPNQIVAGTAKKVWWICSKGHEWKTSINLRTSELEYSCPYCANKKVLEGYNDLVTTNPELAKEWHPTKNGNLKPNQIVAGSNKRVWWQCNKGHEWDISPNSRTGKNPNNCPYCVNKKILKGYNDLATTHPELSKEWHPTKNCGLKPNQVVAGSKEKVWWICSKGHEWEAQISNRASNNRGCHYCTNQKVLEGYNDLATIRPELAKEWHPTKNGDLKPNQVVAGYSKKVWWQCKNGHEWQVSPDSRSKRGCPICQMSRRTSFSELSIYYYLKKVFNDIESRDYINDLEVDIYIPSLSFGIEYDGYYWHKNKDDKDYKKTKILSNSIKLLRVRENGLKPIDFKNCINILRSDNTSDESLEHCINLVFEFIVNEYMLTDKILNKINEIDVNLKRDRVDIYNLIDYIELSNSLESKYPNISKEWHPTKNGNLKPSQLLAGSNKKVWWMCDKGHEWEAKVVSRTYKKTNCPYCSNQKILKGYNDLATTHPDIIQNWNYNKNINLNPNEVVAGSGKKVWWICNNCSNEYERRIYSHIKSKKCPNCKQ